MAGLASAAASSKTQPACNVCIRVLNIYRVEVQLQLLRQTTRPFIYTNNVFLIITFIIYFILFKELYLHTVLMWVNEE